MTQNDSFLLSMLEYAYGDDIDLLMSMADAEDTPLSDFLARIVREHWKRASEKERAEAVQLFAWQGINLRPFLT
jgi:hypothetical protein